MKRNAVLFWLSIVWAPLVATAEPVQPPVTETISTVAISDSTQQQLGEWQTAASNTISPTEKLSFTINIMKWHEQMNSQLVAPTVTPQSLGIAIRGAYHFSGKWQGYLQIQPEQSPLLHTETQHHLGVAYQSGVRYTFSSGLFLEGALHYDTQPSAEAEVDQLLPQLSFGYHF